MAKVGEKRQTVHDFYSLSVIMEQYSECLGIAQEVLHQIKNGRLGLVQDGECTAVHFLATEQLASAVLS